MDPTFAPGTVLGGRFELHGVVGRGGTGTVVLATDRLRAERVALKIVHPHLAADPATRRRLRREVHTASVLHADAALVPHDLHELDGVLALSMPFHPGQTLAERVGSGGPLPFADVRAIGIRIAVALAEAHRVGILHRDVTANNVLVDDPSDAVLTDFGLSRIVGNTRSTGLLGTAGYAAPEVYAGERADPRSDLYGLGAVLYLALTGRPPFDPKTPMAALKQQLEESQPGVSTLRPDCPPDLADLVGRLLRADPAARPPGARDVVDALERREMPSRPPPVGRPTAADRYLPPGRYTVWIRERSEDRRRRERLRRLSAGAAPKTEDEIARWGRHLVGRVRDALGVPPPDALGPEDRLLQAVASEAGVPHTALLPSPVLLLGRFRLVDTTDEHTARSLVDTARTLGFRAEVVSMEETRETDRRLWALYAVCVTLGWTMLPLLTRWLGPLAFALVLGFTISFPLLVNSNEKRRPKGLEDAGVAFRADLRGALREGTAATPRYASEAPPVPVEVRPTAGPDAHRSTALLRRAEEALDALEATAASIDLPDVARADLRATARSLRAQATALAADIERIEPALRKLGDDGGALLSLQSRLDRLDTLARAGETANHAERDRLRRALVEHESNQDAADRLEAQLAASTAQLLEIASTASRVRRELLLDPEPRSQGDLVKQLERESRALNDARREAGRRAAATRQEQAPRR